MIVGGRSMNLVKGETHSKSTLGDVGLALR